MPEFTRRVLQDAVIYEKPDSKSAKLGTIPANTLIKIHDLQRTWLLVENPANTAQRGYITTKALQRARTSTGYVRPVPANVKDSLEYEASQTPSGPSATEVRTEVREAEDTVEEAKVEEPVKGTPESAPLAPKNLISKTTTYLEKVTANVWNKYGGLLSALAEKYGINPIIGAAVMAVESGGSAFGADGRMIIRFENHLFFNYWGKDNKAVYDQHFKFNSTQKWKDHAFRLAASDDWLSFHGNQTLEWVVLGLASSMSRTAARMSISMGAPQILGSNYKVVGFSSVDEMFSAFNDKENGERWQTIAFFKFIENDYRNRGIPALQNEDFVAFAEMYNGPGQAQTYGNLIAERFQILKQLLGT